MSSQIKEKSSQIPSKRIIPLITEEMCVYTLYMHTLIHTPLLDISQFHGTGNLSSTWVVHF